MLRALLGKEFSALSAVKPFSDIINPMSAWIEILIIFLLILANGVLAMAEIAIVSARKARLEQLAQEGDSRARSALKLARAPGNPGARGRHDKGGGYLYRR